MSIEYYRLVNNCTISQSVIKPVEYKKPPADSLVSDAVKVTLAQVDTAVSQVLTAHNLKDYRRRKFSLHLLEDITLPIDILIAQEVPEDEFL